MKAKINKLKLFSAIVATCFVAPAFAQLGGLKNAAKNAATKTTEKKADETKKETKNSASSAADPYTLNKEKGDKAFEERRWDDAKKAYESAASSTTSDYMKSAVQGKADEAAENSKKCTEKISNFNKFYNEKNYADALKIWDGEVMSFNVQEKCICEDKMKQQSEDCRKQLGQQKADNEQKQMDEAQAMLTQMEDMKYKCNPLEPGDGISSPMHTKYLKKLVFAKSEIAKAQENEANFTNSFTLTDNIYSRVYLEKSTGFESGNIGHCYGGDGGFIMRFTFDNGATKMPEWLGESNEGIRAEKNWTTWQPAISPSAADLDKPDYSVKNFVKIVRNLPAGTHKVKMEVVYDIPDDEKPSPPAKYIENCKLFTTKFGPEKVLAVGEFNLNVTEADKKALYKKVCPMYKTQIADYNRPAFTLVPNAVALAKITTGVDWKKFTLLKIVGDIDWTYNKNVYGIILSRKAYAGVYLLNNEDGFIYYSKAEYSQENTSSGGATYAATRVWVEEQNIEYTRNYDSFCKECIGK
ncbi:MAG: hypothetical protein V4667_11645 [Bacteroidota bacterium]